MKYVGLQEGRTDMKIKIYNSKRFAEYENEYTRLVDSVHQSRKMWYKAMDAMGPNPTDEEINRREHARSEYDDRKFELEAYERFLVENVLFGNN